MCIFCKILNKEINSEIVYEEEDFFVINDIAPKAKKHYLFIPKNHYKLLSEANVNDVKILSNILTKIPTLAQKLGLEEGYRLIINQGDNGGQIVPHLHIHILGGEKLD